MNELSFEPGLDRLPPQNIEAEEAVLGSIMLSPDGSSIEAVMPILEPDAFYLNAHKEIYQAALFLHQQDKPTDLISVTNWLSDHELLIRVGGRNKLATLVDLAVTNANIVPLAELVMQKYHRRQLIKTGNEIVKLGYDQTIETAEAVSEAEGRIFSLSRKQNGERYKVCSAPDMAVALYEKLAAGKLSGDKIGWYDEEELTGGIYRPSLVIVAGESHMGKSHYMISKAYAVMSKLNRPALYISPEMDKDQVNTRLLAHVTGISGAELQRNTEKYWTEISAGLDHIATLPWKVYDHSGPTPQMIASAVRQSIAEFGDMGAVFIDYLQQLPVDPGNLAFELGKVTRQIRDIAKYHKVPIFLGCQINRGNQMSGDKRPTRHLLRNSGEIYEVCDQLIMLYRDSVYSKDESDRSIELIVEKNRLCGKLGTAKMLCDLETSTFLNMARGY